MSNSISYKSHLIIDLAAFLEQAPLELQEFLPQDQNHVPAAAVAVEQNEIFTVDDVYPITQDDTELSDEEHSFEIDDQEIADLLADQTEEEREMPARVLRSGGAF